MLVCSILVIVAMNLARADEGEGASILLVLVLEISGIVAMNWARADEGKGASILLVLVLEISGIIAMNWARADEGEGAYQVHWLQEMVRWEVAEGVVLVVVLTGG